MFESSQKPLKVLYVEAPSARFGSTISLLALVSSLDRTKIEPVVVINSLNPGAEDFRRLLIQVHEMELPGAVGYFGEARRGIQVGRFQEGGFSFVVAFLKYLRDKFVLRSQTQALQAIIDAVCPDIVHLNNQPSTNRFAYYCDFKGAKLIQHIRGAPLTRSRLISFLCRRVDLFVCISEFVKRSLISDLLVNRATKVVYNPIASEFYDIPRAASTRERKPFLFVQIGRIIPLKGQKTLIEAALLLKSRGWSVSDMRVNLIGALEHHTQYETELRGFVRSHDLNDLVLFSPYSPDVIGALSLADALIHVTSEAEGFGRVVAEAMATGLPVIVSGNGALPELVSDGMCGLVANNPEDLANAMEILLRNSDRCFELGSAARKKAEEFHVSRHAGTISDCYRQLQ